MTRVIEIYSRNVDRSVKEILSTVEKEYTIQRQKEAREESDRHSEFHISRPSSEARTYHTVSLDKG
jgi:hypothetical protein